MFLRSGNMRLSEFINDVLMITKTHENPKKGQKPKEAETTTTALSRASSKISSGIRRTINGSLLLGWTTTTTPWTTR